MLLWLHPAGMLAQHMQQGPAAAGSGRHACLAICSGASRCGYRTGSNSRCEGFIWLGKVGEAKRWASFCSYHAAARAGGVDNKVSVAGLRGRARHQYN